MSPTLISTNKPNYFKLATMPWTCQKCNTTRRVRLYQKIWHCAFCGNDEDANVEQRQKAIEEFKRNGPEHYYKRRIDKGHC